MTLDEAKAALREAENALYEAERARNRVADVARNAVHEKFAGQINPLREAAAAARMAVTQVKNAVPDHEWEGLKVFRMVSRGYSFQRLSPSRVEGIVETVRIGTRFAENLSHYSTPEIGDVIVRLLKKDGTPGLKFENRDKDWKLAEEPAS